MTTKDTSKKTAKSYIDTLKNRKLQGAQVVGLVISSVVLLLSAGTLLWFRLRYSQGQSMNDVPVALSYFSAFSIPLASFSLGSLAGFAILWLSDLKLPRALKIIFRVLGYFYLVVILSVLLIPFVPYEILATGVVYLPYTAHIVSVHMPALVCALGFIFALGFAQASQRKNSEQE